MYGGDGVKKNSTYRIGRIQEIAEGFAAGEMEAKKETAVTFAEKGMPVTDIAGIVKVSVKTVQEWLSANMTLV